MMKGKATGCCVSLHIADNFHAEQNDFAANHATTAFVRN
jgi:hypothetical protein